VGYDLQSRIFVQLRQYYIDKNVHAFVTLWTQSPRSKADWSWLIARSIAGEESAAYRWSRGNWTVDYGLW